MNALLSLHILTTGLCLCSAYVHYCREIPTRKLTRRIFMIQPEQFELKKYIQSTLLHRRKEGKNSSDRVSPIKVIDPLHSEFISLSSAVEAYSG